MQSCCELYEYYRVPISPADSCSLAKEGGVAQHTLSESRFGTFYFAPPMPHCVLRLWTYSWKSPWRTMALRAALDLVRPRCYLHDGRRRVTCPTLEIISYMSRAYKKYIYMALPYISRTENTIYTCACVTSHHTIE